MKIVTLLAALLLTLSQAQTVSIVAAGDLVCSPDMAGVTRPDLCRHQAVADLAAEQNPDAVLLLGDIQYERGTLEAFESQFDPSWGALKDITFPVPGNHEYYTRGAAGYFAYFGERAGEPGAGYYSFDLGAWHLVALNSNCDFIGGCGEDSPQAQWLRADLEAHPARCILAFFHHPRFSSGLHNNHPALDTLWTVLEQAGAELVLSGHDHHYERFAPQTLTAQPVPTGIRQFVVGTGGRGHYPTLLPRQNSEVINSATLGLLQLELMPEGYSWTFLGIEGSSFSDSGEASCH